MTLHPDTLLSIHLSATISRNRYTTNPDAVIAELRAIAGDRVDILTTEVGSWIGYYGDTPGVETITTALRGMPDLDLDDAIRVGRERRGAPRHGAR